MIKQTIILLLLSSGLMAQNRGNIGQPGAGASAPIFDSLGIALPAGEIVIGTGTKAPDSSDSLTWSAGLTVGAPLQLTGLAAVALDSMLYIDSLGFVGKTALGTNMANADQIITGNRIHNGNGMNFTIDNLNSLFFGNNTASGSITLDNSTTLLSRTSGVIELEGPTVTFDAPDIILSDALTLSTWDSVLVRHPTTGEIQARLASTITDSLGRNGTAGQIVFETATKAPNSSANFFYDEASIELGIGTNAPGRKLHIVSNIAAGEGITIDNNSATGYASILLLNDGAGSGGFFYGGTGVGAYGGAGALNLIQVSTAPLTLGTSNNVRLHISGGGSVAIGNAAPAASAKLDITGTTGGLLPPRMTGTQRDAISSPAEGLILFNSTTSKLQVRAGAAWVDLH